MVGWFNWSRQLTKSDVGVEKVFDSRGSVACGTGTGGFLSGF